LGGRLSVKRTVVQGVIAGLALGLLQDGMTSPHPTHALSLAFSGNFDCSIAEAALHPGRLFTSLNCLGMAVLAETVTALQFSFLWRSPGGAEARAVQNLAEIWTYHQQTSVLLSLVASGHPWFITPQSLVGANERFRAFLASESRRNTGSGEKELADSLILRRLVDDYYRECSTTPFRQK